MDLCIEDTDFNKHQILNLKGEVGFYLLKSYYWILMNLMNYLPPVQILNQWFKVKESWTFESGVGS